MYNGVSFENPNNVPGYCFVLYPPH